MNEQNKKTVANLMYKYFVKKGYPKATLYPFEAVAYLLQAIERNGTNSTMPLIEHFNTLWHKSYRRGKMSMEDIFFHEKSFKNIVWDAVQTGEISKMQSKALPKIFRCHTSCEPADILPANQLAELIKKGLPDGSRKLRFLDADARFGEIFLALRFLNLQNIEYHGLANCESTGKAIAKMGKALNFQNLVNPIYTNIEKLENNTFAGKYDIIIYHVRKIGYETIPDGYEPTEEEYGNVIAENLKKLSKRLQTGGKMIIVYSDYQILRSDEKSKMPIKGIVHQGLLEIKSKLLSNELGKIKETTSKINSWDVSIVEGR